VAGRAYGPPRLPAQDGRRPGASPPRAGGRRCLPGVLPGAVRPGPATAPSGRSGRRPASAGLLAAVDAFRRTAPRSGAGKAGPRRGVVRSSSRAAPLLLGRLGDAASAALAAALPAQRLQHEVPGPVAFGLGRGVELGRAVAVPPLPRPHLRPPP